MKLFLTADSMFNIKGCVSSKKKVGKSYCVCSSMQPASRHNHRKMTTFLDVSSSFPWFSTCFFYNGRWDSGLANFDE